MRCLPRYSPVKRIFLACVVFYSLGAGLYAQSDPGDSYEPDSRERPVPVQLGMWMSRALHREDKDWFTIRPASPGILIAETGGDTDTIITLYRGNDVIAQNDDNMGDVTSLIEYPVTSGVDYTICVEGYDESETGPYRFVVSFEAIRDAGEPNDVPSQATPFSPGSAISAYFLTPYDLDWYRYMVPSPGILAIHTEGTVDTIITMYDSNDSLLAEDDDSGENANASVSAKVTPGMVFIRVSSYDGQLGKYTLKGLLYEPATPDRFENDDTAAGARDITPGSSQERNFTDASDEDWVRLRITRRGTYDIFAQAADDRLDTYLELYDSNDDLVDANDDWDEGWNARLRLEIEPGTYYIKVTTLSSNPIDNSAYVLSVTTR